MTVTEEGRSIAIRRYCILCVIMGLLSGGLMVCGTTAVKVFHKEGGFGPPYYIGGLLVGILVRESSASVYFVLCLKWKFRINSKMQRSIIFLFKLFENTKHKLTSICCTESLSCKLNITPNLHLKCWSL